MAIKLISGIAHACLLILLTSTTANAATVYNVDRTIGNGTVTGFIETDGTIGVLASANITDWVLTLTAPNLIGGSPDIIDFATNSASVVVGSALSASSTALTFDFTIAGVQNALFLIGSSGNFYCIQAVDRYCDPTGSGEYIGRDATTNRWTEFASQNQIIDIAVAAVPVPAAVWLFGSGLLGLVGIARRKTHA
ncbi:MAG: VPLPA-CTERM sorting domain-containing protein [Gammaproteobacteria bacterium]|nr:VPLPA-CTERM sorting domain-containing protein [Gammaproteobacteria bacterium]